MEAWKLLNNIGFCEIAWIIMFLRPVVVCFNFLFYILKFKFQKVLLSSWRELACFFINKTSQWAFTCSKLTIETLEQGVKYVQS